MEVGQYVETREDMETELTQFFGDIMKEYQGNRSEHITRITQLILHTVTSKPSIHIKKEKHRNINLRIFGPQIFYIFQREKDWSIYKNWNAI